MLLLLLIWLLVNYSFMEKQLYGKTFSSKKEFLKWFEEHSDEIDWDYDVELSWYYKSEEDE